MAKPKLELKLDQEGPIAAGSTLGGTLVVRARSAVVAEHAEVSLLWAASAGGSAESGGRVGWKSDPIDLADGGTASLPFRLDVPRSPRSFTGQLVSVDWIVDARLVGATPAIEPVKGEVVVAGPRDAAAPAAGYRGEVVAAALTDDEPRRAPRGASAGVRVARGVSIFLACLYAIVTGARGGKTLLFLALAFVGVFFVWSIVAPLLARAAARSLGEPRVELSSSRLAPGDAVDLAITVDPAQWQDVERVVAKLCRVEVAPPGEGTVVREHRMRGEVVELSGAITFQPGVPQRFAAKLRVPREATPGFTLPGGFAVRWEAVVLFAMPRGGGDRIATADLEIVDSVA